MRPNITFKKIFDDCKEASLVFIDETNPSEMLGEDLLKYKGVVPDRILYMMNDYGFKDYITLLIIKGLNENGRISGFKPNKNAITIRANLSSEAATCLSILFHNEKILKLLIEGNRNHLIQIMKPEMKKLEADLWEISFKLYAFDCYFNR